MELLTLGLLNGVAFGMILFLLASGLSLVLGLMGILNLAHGALYMVGAYVGWSIAVKAGLNFWLGVLAGGIVVGFLARVMERGFIRKMYGQDLDQALLTFGFVYILTNVSQWIWGAIPKPPFTTSLLSASFPLMSYTYPLSRISIIVIGLAIAVGLWWTQDKTRLGAIVRAGMDNRQMTMGLGINLELVFPIVFFFGAFLAGSAGVIGAQILGVNLSFSADILLWSLAVVIVGGMGSVQGALAGGLILGIVDSFGKALFPGFAMFTIYLAMIIILLVKPHGLLGRVARTC
jgi:branched-chain amino acid transport system permease protein